MDSSSSPALGKAGIIYIHFSINKPPPLQALCVLCHCSPAAPRGLSPCHWHQDLCSAELQPCARGSLLKVDIPRFPGQDVPPQSTAVCAASCTAPGLVQARKEAVTRLFKAVFNVSCSVYDLGLLLWSSVRKTASVQVLELLMKSLGSSQKPSAPAPAMLKVKSKKEKVPQGFSFSRKLSEL